MDNGGWVLVYRYKKKAAGGCTVIVSKYFNADKYLKMLRGILK